MTDPRDPLSLRDDAPLLAAWLDATAPVRPSRPPGAAPDGHPFTIPGHKGRTTLVGAVVTGDVPLYGGLDTVGLAHGHLADAERRAAAWWGGDWCRLSVGGSTHGNQALALAVARPGRSVIVARTLHRSLLLGLVLADLRPIWVTPPIDPGTGLPGAVPVAAVERALATHPEAAAVFLGDPSYVGVCGDLVGQAAVAHRVGIPLIVDAAWGAHFGAHSQLPPSPLAAGADAMVTSAHKLLPAMSQAAVIAARTPRSGGLLDPDRLDRAFEATHTTSPAGAILASADAARALLAEHGSRLLTDVIARVAQVGERLSAIPGVVAVAGELPDRSRIDPTKLVLLLAGTGADGRQVEADLIAAGFPVEMADRDVVIPIVTVADRDQDLNRFVAAFTASIATHRAGPRPLRVPAAWSVRPEQALPPREAFFAVHRAVPLDQAVGAISAELVAPYPPGVPVLAPGERITAQTVELLRVAVAAGTRIAYAADPTLRTVHVVEPGSTPADTPSSRD